MDKTREWNGHKGVILDSRNEFDVIDCRACGFKHIVPIPTADELEEVYRHDYYSKEKPLYLKRYTEDIDWWNLVYDERYDIFEKFLPPEKRTIIDIGSGPGFFLLRGKERNWQTLGIEPSAQAAAHSRALGLEIVEQFLSDETATSLGTFDALHMSNVLEHVPDPAEMLNLCKRLLSPDGLLCIVVPNDYNPFQRALRTSCDFAPWWVAPPHHINYFDFDSLPDLLQRCGFDVQHREATFPIDLFLLMGDNYIGNDELGRTCHLKRKKFEAALEAAGLAAVKRALYQSLAKINVGREVCIFAKQAG